MSKDLLYEIGTEEIPANYMPSTLKQVRSISEAMLKNYRIAFEEIKAYGTPRRIVLFVKGIAEQQENLEELVKGPSKRAAYDENGNPTKALLGFLKGQKAELGDVFIQELAGVEYVYYKKQEKGQPVKEVLKTILPDILTSISFPKSMKWGNKSFRFARPVRWLVPILGDELIEFDKDGIQCSRYTKGHRVLSKGSIEINNTSEYFDKLRAGFVIADQEERRTIIRRQCEELAREKGGEVLMDEELLEEIVYLVEYPTALIGGFDAEYLKLPKEAVITPMKEHQRYFPVADSNKNLMNYFITVRNGDSRFLETVQEGNEKVLKARLADADFFYREDRKESLDNCAEKLKNVVFQETLGTIYDKTQRIAAIAEHLAAILGISAGAKKNLLRAAHLCKADLVTNMVKEFDELQGIMGREYALLQGEDREVADAIFEHYLPRFAGDNTPATLNGSILSISDKMDTICGCFAIGIQPTGSQDPYALRRQAIGVTSIILDSNIHLGLTHLIDNSLKPFEAKGILKGDEKSVKRDILEFFRQRFKNVMIDKGFEYDIIDAVINAEFDDINDAYLKIRELSKWKYRDEFMNILGSFNRVSNLASKAMSPEINAELFTEKAELELLRAFDEVNAEFEGYVDNREYGKALELMITLKKPVDDFFDNIMVMVEDEDIRNNRLGLLKSIADMMNRMADLGSIVVNK
ncbi:MAG TPA: glycine--tRNA ligase subunit beta [Bacillota bacterium]|nr:glycine--tRNA ligase subunit beta [Bacillota bacterium]HQE66731.1 glycine--tRNA ligase subunit beta [Bacillota bacterium]HQI16011.1 glycine--tRNA ligase subunit beta [Bacillota bacterium]HQJ37500.1 glycine--tRNA ligase subunit beta [Bacillota bacterium]HRS21044.1 glycine--tRNA ligase subunit beta [Clostridia bacterium]